ncbi:MAG: DUF1398 family protein [Holophagaceae bacterium]|jgi:uncharacterized protein YbcV (DUF1398 family)|uniref:DUF1398 family protein n=1 Tax=Candidatus Geothrix odensensis TaxID=2954440 RepID=A0A936K5X2_9BACT|nr:DUF1398 family protein [Candidatus Geothrix odensensis]
MSDAIENLKAAQERGMAGRPKEGGFPYLAETLRRAGITRNLWHLPSCQSIYLTEMGPVAVPGTPLIDGMAEVPPFNREALISALRADQAGRSTFPEFLQASWKAGVVGYDIDLIGRTCTYHGAGGETYVESYPEVEL